MINNQSNKTNNSRIVKHKLSFAMNTLTNDLYLLLLEMISNAIENNDNELLLAFNIDDDIKNQLKHTLLSLESEEQLQVLDNIGYGLFDFSMKSGMFSLNYKYAISDEDSTLRLIDGIYICNINFLLLRLVSKAAHLYDVKWLELFGIKFEDAINILQLGALKQRQLSRDYSELNGLAINVVFKPEFFYLANMQIQQQRTINSFINTLLDNKVDCSRTTLKNYFGILPNEFSARKKLLNQTSKRGPKYQLTNDEALLIDADWVKDISYFKNLFNDLDNEWQYISNELMKYYVLHKKYSIPIGSIISHNQNILSN